tara:strand:- start:4054 stop:4716 length:663 start_codon:yes stop_codon:yes gene_type:complete
MDHFDDFEESLSSLDYWRLCDELTVIQAALLLSGHDPSSDQEYIENWGAEQRPDGYEGAKAAISRALIRDLIDGELVPEFEYDINGHLNGDKPGTIDLKKSTVNVDSLKRWLRERGISTGFFFHITEDKPDYLDPKHPRYSPKLAAAVSAWFAIDDEAALKGRSAKQALEKWLRENAAKFNLSNEDGKPNEKGIEECAKVANWQYKGGAPKTPSENPGTP